MCCVDEVLPTRVGMVRRLASLRIPPRSTLEQFRPRLQLRQLRQILLRIPAIVERCASADSADKLSFSPNFLGKKKYRKFVEKRRFAALAALYNHFSETPCQYR